MYKVLLIFLVLTGCAAKPTPMIDLSELRAITVDTNSCKNLDNSVIWLENQQRLVGIPLGSPPELLSEHDREYQARLRVMVWALRIGCTNPDRYHG